MRCRTTLRALFVLFLVGVASGCGRGGPQSSAAATASRAAPARAAGYQPTEGDRFYWSCVCEGWRDCGARADDPRFEVLPIREVSDPVLIDVHNAWMDFFRDQREGFEAMATLARDAQTRLGPHDEQALAALNKFRSGESLGALMQKLKMAGQRYGPLPTMPAAP